MGWCAGGVVSTTTSQYAGSGFKPAGRPRAFQYGFLHTLPVPTWSRLGPSVSSHNSKTFRLDHLATRNVSIGVTASVNGCLSRC